MIDDLRKTVRKMVKESEDEGTKVCQTNETNIHDNGSFLSKLLIQKLALPFPYHAEKVQRISWKEEERERKVRAGEFPNGKSI